MVLASGVVFGLSLSGCAKAPTNSVSTPAPAPASSVLAPEGAPPLVDTKLSGPGPHNALVADLGKPSAPAVDEHAAATIKQIAATVSASHRATLRYALALDAAGHVHLVVYDGLGLPADGKPPGKKFEYTVFRILNAHDGSTYDPQQDAIVEAVPPPPERDSTITIK